MPEYKIVHYENDGYNNVYNHLTFVAENLVQAITKLESYVDCSDPIYIDYEPELEYSVTFDRKGERQSDDEELSTDTWSVIKI